MGLEEGLVERLLTGEARALARAISIVEDRLPSAREIMERITPRAGRAPIIGVTGPPGAGKSTLVDGLTALFRREGKRVGIIAVDPSSAFSGGAVLGDRIRMQRHSTDEGVFIRSMATRGHFGGLASASVDVTDLMGAAGCDVVIIETVGVGQDEVDVVRVADLVLVVLVPGMGDDIQTIKAGIMEIPDIFVLNKADRDGIDRLHTDVKTMLGLIDQPGRRAPEILRTVAPTGQGLDELHRAIEAHLQATPPDMVAQRRRERSRERLLDLLRERVLEWAVGPSSGGAFDQMVEELADRSRDPYSAADLLLRNFRPPGGGA
ncbi:MAG TPA: methylmalonyl Co-A mutase-associated GTPase MeaB [Candidatus Polarisedimenticolia bacterium]|jgi:LAO/AO transport system kinase